MSEEPRPLASKIKITTNPETPGTSHKHIGFYRHYSSFVFKSLNKPTFQRFLQWMLKKENIQERKVTEVHVKVFPLRRGKGKGLAGNCNPACGKIRIYPKTMTFCQAFKQKFGKNTFLAYAASRARAALIHELLHLKYATDEKRVRKLSREYFFAFARRALYRDRLSFLSYTMIFMVRQAKPFNHYNTNVASALSIKL